MTPLARVEVLYHDLVAHYQGAEDAEVRAAAKLLLVAIAELKRYGGAGWAATVREYLGIAEDDPAQFDRILRASRNDAATGTTEEDAFLC